MNYCNCKLTINCDHTRVLDTLTQIATSSVPQYGISAKFKSIFKSKVKTKSQQLLEFMNPMPRELAAQVTNGFSGDEPQWRKWRVKHWGCPYEAEISNTQLTDNRTLKIDFYTPNSPPVAAIRQGARMHQFKFSLLFYEPGIGFIGSADQTEYQEFMFDPGKSPDTQGIPDKLVSIFDLHSVYNEYQQG